MTEGSPPRLTERQAAVMERVDRRVPIKVIASELDVSETRINQHIRKLKDAYGVGSLNDLVEAHRAQAPEALAEAPYRKAEYTKTHLRDPAEDRPFGARGDPGEIVFSDALTFPVEAPWERREEPQVVPGVLDGSRAVIYRLAAIIGIAFGLVAAVILVVTASVSLTEAFDGVARISEDNTQSPG